MGNAPFNLKMHWFPRLQQWRKELMARNAIAMLRLKVTFLWLPQLFVSNRSFISLTLQRPWLRR
jgi:hypothetical protein